VIQQSNSLRSLISSIKCALCTSRLCLRLLLTVVPQCIRRWHDTRQRSHLANAAKYASSVLVLVLAALFNTLEADVTRWGPLEVLSFFFFFFYLSILFY
jgi:hypothetical protein